MKYYLSLNDQELIHLYLNGDIKAFTALMERHKSKIYSCIFLLVKDKYLAEDFFQETFIKILDKLHKGEYAESGKFLPWAMMIARNLCIDYFRKIKRTPGIVSADGHQIFNFVHGNETTAEEKRVKSDTYSEINKLLEELPEEQREVVIMRHYAELSFKEIAAITSCSVNTALGRMRYGLINLRKMMVEKQITLCVVYAIGQHI
jgi:RNA polymerase sigma factor (sigma-70 family)